MSKEQKYDTDPLDEGFVRQTDEIFAATRQIARPPNEAARQDALGEEPTRRLPHEPIPPSYPSVFVPPVYQPPAAANQNAQFGAPPLPGRIGRQRVVKLGVQENVASAMAYTPFFIGLIISLVELLLLPRSEVKTRTHAAQALALHLTILATGAVFQVARFLAGLAGSGFATGMLSLFSGLFSLAALIFLVVTMVRVWRGEDVRHSSVADVTKWINQHLDPLK